MQKMGMSAYLDSLRLINSNLIMLLFFLELPTSVSVFGLEPNAGQFKVEHQYLYG